MQQLAAMEHDETANTVTAGDFSPTKDQEAKHSYAALIFGAALFTVSICAFSVVLIRTAIRRRTQFGAADRRANARYAMPPERAIITLQTPYGEIKADPVDISTGGIQIVMTEEQPSKSNRSKSSDKIRLTLKAAGAGGTRILDSIPCMICWARKDRLGLRFDTNISLEPLFALQMMRTSPA